MTLDLESVQVASLFVNSLSIIREKAAIAAHPPGHRRRRGRWGRFRPTRARSSRSSTTCCPTRSKFTVEGGQVTLRASRVPRAEVGRLSGAWTGRTFPLGRQRVRESFSRSASPTAASASRRRASSTCSSLSVRSTAAWRENSRARDWVWLWSSSSPSCMAARWRWRAPWARAPASPSGCRSGRRKKRRSPQVKAPAAPASSRRARGRALALVVEDDFKSADLIRVQLEAEGFKVLHAASAEAALRARGAAAAVAHHPRHHAAQHGRLGIPQPPQAGAGARAHPGRDHFDRRGSQQGLRARRRGGHAKAHLAARAATSRSSISVSFPSRRAARSRCWWSTTIPGAVELIAVRILGMASTVLRACGGRDAVDMARRDLPDLIVLDLMMPDVNGFDVVRL